MFSSKMCTDEICPTLVGGCDDLTWQLAMKFKLMNINMVFLCLNFLFAFKGFLL